MSYPEPVNYTGIMLRLLDFLGSDPDTSFHVREIAERTGISVGATSMTLRVMERYDWITSEPKGSMKFYRFNLLSPASRQWKILFNVNKLRNLVDALKPCTDRIVLFGSCAEGTDSKDSDVDLLIKTQNHEIVSRLIARFQKSFPKPIAPIIVTPEKFAKIHKDDRPLFDEILKGKDLWNTQ